MATFVAVCGLVATVSSTLLAFGKLVSRPIYTATTNFLLLSSNLDAMQRKMQDLGNLVDQVNQQVDEAERNRGAATYQATEWRRQTQDAMAVAEAIMDPAGLSEGTTKTRVSRGCFFRCSLSERVSKTLNELQRLAEAYPTQIVLPSHRRVPEVEHTPTVSLEDQSTATQNLAKLMDLLNRDGVRSIGVWGMGGVGKTTLLRNLNNKLLSLSSSTQSFGKVIWTVASREMNHKQVQKKIAQRLEFDLRDGDEVSMAAQLHERLLQENKFILILDDVWEFIDVHLLGIPLPEVHKGYKILLTTRSQAICLQMKMAEQFKILPLNDDEAWQLFRTTVGEVANSEEIIPHARLVNRECNGLPLAIKVVGASMIGKVSLELWRDALNELRRSRPSTPGIEKEVFNPLKWSYDSLQNENIKSCFLFCCLYPEDYRIDTRNQLVQCWIGEGLIDGLSYENSFDRGIAIVETLRDACLLENVKFDQCTVHDIVRDVGIWIAASLKDGPNSLVIPGTELSQVAEAIRLGTHLKRLSLINNKIKKLPDDHSTLQCPKTLTLFLQGTEFDEEAVQVLLQGFPSSRVLNLTDTNINLLPHSIMQLGDLRTLLLNRCKLLKELPASGWEGLAKLEMLDLSGTDIRELPGGLKTLLRLRELHVCHTKSLVSIPTETIATLPCLEVLNMKGSEYVWKLKEEAGDGKAHLEELENLNKLRVLCIRTKLTSPNSQVNLTWIGRLATFRLAIGGNIRFAYFVGATRELVLVNMNFDAEEERIEYVLSSTNVTVMILDNCEGLDRMVQSLALNSSAPFSTLKTLIIAKSSFSPTRGCYSAQHDLLPNLEHVELIQLKGVESLSQLFAPLGLRLSKLRWLTVGGCKELKHLLSLGGLIQNLAKLEVIGVGDSPEMEELFTYDNNVVSDSLSVLPNLRIIKLSFSPKLRAMCKQIGGWPRIEVIEVRRCPELKKLQLTSENKNSIKEIKGEASWWSQLECDDIATKDSLQPFFIAQDY